MAEEMYPGWFFITTLMLNGLSILRALGEVLIVAYRVRGGLLLGNGV